MIKSLLFFRISNHNRLLVITEKLLAKYIRLFLTDSQKYGSVLKNSIDEYPAADFNGDGKITALDAAAIAKHLAEQSIGGK